MTLPEQARALAEVVMRKSPLGAYDTAIANIAEAEDKARALLAALDALPHVASEPSDEAVARELAKDWVSGTQTHLDVVRRVRAAEQRAKEASR